MDIVYMLGQLFMFKILIAMDIETWTLKKICNMEIGLKN